MMKRSTVTSRGLLAAAGCTALIACAQAGGSGDAAPAAAKEGAAGSWTQAAAKPNGSGVRLAYNVAPMQPGRVGSVQLRLSGVTADDARVEWRAPAGGVVTSAAVGAATSMSLPRGQVTTQLLDVTAAADGMAYLDVFTTQGGRTTAQSVPLKVGSGAIVLKREGTAQTMPSGEKVISLPSQPK